MNIQTVVHSTIELSIGEKLIIIYFIRKDTGESVQFPPPLFGEDKIELEIVLKELTVDQHHKVTCVFDIENDSYILTDEQGKRWYNLRPSDPCKVVPDLNRYTFLEFSPTSYPFYKNTKSVLLTYYKSVIEGQLYFQPDRSELIKLRNDIDQKLKDEFNLKLELNPPIGMFEQNRFILKPIEETN